MLKIQALGFTGGLDMGNEREGGAKYNLKVLVWATGRAFTEKEHVVGAEEGSGSGQSI